MRHIQPVWPAGLCQSSARQHGHGTVGAAVLYTSIARAADGSQSPSGRQKQATKEVRTRDTASSRYVDNPFIASPGPRWRRACSRRIAWVVLHRRGLCSGSVWNKSDTRGRVAERARSPTAEHPTRRIQRARPARRGRPAWRAARPCARRAPHGQQRLLRRPGHPRAGIHRRPAGSPRDVAGQRGAAPRS